MIPEELAGAYVREAARFRADRPDLDGLAPCCGWCVRRVDTGSIGTGTSCSLTGEVMAMGDGCNTGGFTYDSRPLWEQYPWISRREWQRRDGMVVATDAAVAQYEAEGGDVGALPGIEVGGRRWLLPIFPGPSLAASEYTAGESVAESLRRLQAERVARSGVTP